MADTFSCIHTNEYYLSISMEYYICMRSQHVTSKILWLVYWNLYLFLLINSENDIRLQRHRNEDNRKKSKWKWKFSISWELIKYFFIKQLFGQFHILYAEHYISQAGNFIDLIFVYYFDIILKNFIYPIKFYKWYLRGIIIQSSDNLLQLILNTAQIDDMMTTVVLFTYTEN